MDITHTGWERLGADAETLARRPMRAAGAGLLPYFVSAVATPEKQEEEIDGTGSGTREDPWELQDAAGYVEYQMWRDESADPPALVCQVGSTQLKYHLSAIDDLHAMLKAHGDWMDLGAADEQKDAKPGTVEAWGRADDNPVGGWYGLRKGYRGRFGMYLPPCSRPSAWPS